MAGVLAAGPLAGQTTEPDQPISEERLKEIESAQTADELIELGQRYIRRRKTAAAAACVEKICRLKPEMLTDGKEQSPTAWNDFWFAQRATLRVAKLSRTDVAERIKIATWMHDGGATKPAQEMLRRTLEIDQSSAEARALAEKWTIFESGLLRLDLGYALTEPLFPETVRDENQGIEPRSGRKLLWLPFAYQVGSRRFIITKSQVVAKSDEGRPCAVKGIALMSGPERGPKGSDIQLFISSSHAMSRATLRLQGGGEPLWERIQVEPPSDDQKQEQLTCYNTTPPIVRPTPGEKREPSRERSRDRSRDRRSDSDSYKQTRPGTGYVAFLIEVPESSQYIEGGPKGQPPTRLESEFLTMLAEPVNELSDTRRAELVDVLVPQTARLDRPIAMVAVQKLAQIRSAATKKQREPQEDDRPDQTITRIDNSLLTAMGFIDPHVRREAFKGLIAVETSLHKTTLALIADFRDSSVLLSMLDLIGEILVEAAASEDSEEPSRAQPAAQQSSDDLIQLAVESIPTSSVNPNVFATLSACLKHHDANVRRRAMDITLATGAQQSFAMLAELDDAARNDLINRLPAVKDQKLKTVILRLLLIRAEPRTLSSVLRSFGDPPVTVSSTDDPLLGVFRGYVPDSALPHLLDLLARADLTAVLGSEELSRILETLPVEKAGDPRMREAILKLATSHFNPPYEAPISRSTQRDSDEKQLSEFESLLVSLTTSKRTDRETMRAAASALMESGRIRLLNEKLSQSKSGQQHQDLIQFLAKNKPWWHREALPIFLALRLSDKDPLTFRLALGALAEIDREIDREQRWRLNLAIKQDLDLKTLIELTLHKEEEIARLATGLMKRLTMLPAAELEEFQLIHMAEGRLDQLRRWDEKRSVQTIGHFACMVYLDAKPIDDKKREAGRSSEAKAVSARRNIPLASSVVTMQGSKQAGGQILTQGRNIGSFEAQEESAHGARTQQVTLPIDASPLLRQALVSADAKKEGLAGKVDLWSLDRERTCVLKYDKWGTWSGEVSLPPSMSGTYQDHTWQATGAKIILEPIVR